MKTIAASAGVKRVGPKEGRTIQIGNARLTWKATGIETGYGTSLYEMDLAPGVGIRCKLIRTQKCSMSFPDIRTFCDSIRMVKKSGYGAGQATP